MPALSSLLIPVKISVDPTPTGVEVDAANQSTRRFLDLSSTSQGRIMVNIDQSNDILFRIEFSLDDGATWGTLIDENTLQTIPPVKDRCMYTIWNFFPPEACQDCLVRCLAIGTAGSTPVRFLEFHFR